MCRFERGRFFFLRPQNPGFIAYIGEDDSKVRYLNMLVIIGNDGTEPEADFDKNTSSPKISFGT